MTRSLLLALCLLPAPALAASGGPDSYGYYYVDSSTSGGPTYDSTVFSTTIASGTALGTSTSTGASGADDSNTSISLAFTFPFYGTDYSTAYVCSNGFVSFASYTSLSNTALSSNSYAMVAPFWDDLDQNGTSSWVYRRSSGTSPNRVETIVYSNAEHYNDTSNYGKISFAVQLYENGNIRMLWDDVTFEGTGGSSYSTGLSATVGIDGGSSSGYYTQLSYNATSYLAASKVVEFIHPDNMPVADAGSSRSTSEGGSVSINARSSTPSSGLTYSYDCEGDGTYEETGSSSSSYTCEYDDDGTYSATVEVEYLTYTDTDTTTVTVRNVAPDPVSWFASTTGTSGYGATVDDIVFDDIDEGDVDAVSVACDFDDVASDTITATLDWGDGSEDDTSNYTLESHTYDDDGTYTVSCTASDEDGGTSGDLLASLGYSLTVEVGNVAPTLGSATATGAAEGSAASFVAVATDPGADTLTYSWTFGDGSTGKGASASHTYSDDGTYSWTLKVTDGDGGSTSTSGTVTITNSVPVVTALSLPSTAEGSSATLGATVTAWSGDTLTYAWDFGDGSTSSSKAPTHAWVDDGSYTVTLVVSDEEGSSATLAGTITITNANPVASFSASVADEGAVTSFYGSATDAGTTDTFTYAWDFGDGATDTGASAWHTYAADGDYTVTLTVTDSDGGVDTDVQVIHVGNAAPVITSVSGSTPIVEGDGGSFSASATDAGGDALTYDWDFGDGRTGSGATLTHAYDQDGTYTVKVTVSDGTDSTSSSTTVVVTNAPPAILSASGTDGVEGTALPFAVVSRDPGALDVLTATWDFGDGTTDSGEVISHSFPDNGTWTVTSTVTDEHGEFDTETFTVTVTNADPVVSSVPAATAAEGSVYSYAAAATDPGTADTFTWTLDAAPATASFDSATATVSWTPTYADSFVSHTFTVSVMDDDGGTASQTWSVDVSSLDTDGDGLADGYEDAYGLDKSDASDAAGDADADGVSNLDEALAGTDPTLFDGPSVPTSALMAGVDFDVLDPSLAINNSSSPRGLPLTYDYEVYADEAGTSLVASSAGEPEDGSGMSTWTVDVSLGDDTPYWWRARADDGYVASGWMALDPIFVNLANSAPSVPVPLSPVGDEAVSVLGPSLQWANASDDEGLPFSYDVQVWSGDGATLVTEVVGLPDDGFDAFGEWVASPDLPDESSYLWTVRATDTQGLSGEWSEFAAFRVSTSGLAPTDPNWITPRNGEELSTVTPVLQWTASEDPEGYPLSYHVQADASSGFDSADQLDEVLAETELDLAAAGLVLPENTLLYLRVRAEDVSGTGSAWDTIEVYSRGENDAPPPPVLISPIDGATSAPEAELVFAESVDPEGDAARYSVIVSANADLSSPVFEDDWSATGTGTVSGLVVPPLAEGEWYWAANTTDSFGAESGWSEPGSFVVAATDDGGPTDSGNGYTVDESGDCGCASGASPWAGASLLAAGALLARRRRP